jgi:hypothetical protein
LTAESETTLLGVQGGYSGSASILYRITLGGDGNSFVSAVPIAQIDLTSNSGGDIARTPAGDYIAAVNSGQEIWRIPLDGSGNPNPAGATKVCTTSIAWVGALSYDDVLYAGVFQGSTIYTLNLATGALTQAPVTGYALKSGVFGMDVVPEPASMAFLALGGAALMVRRRAKASGRGC